MKTLTFSNPYEFPMEKLNRRIIEEVVVRGTELYGFSTGPHNCLPYYRPYCFHLYKLNIETRLWEHVDLSKAPGWRPNLGGSDARRSTIEVAGDSFIFEANALPAELNFERQTLRMLPALPWYQPYLFSPVPPKVYSVDNISQLHPALFTDKSSPDP